MTPRGRLISDNASEGTDGQEIKRNDKVAEAAAQKRNEKRLAGVRAIPILTRVSIIRPNRQRNNVLTAEALSAPYNHLGESLAVDAFLLLGCTDCCTIHR